MKEAATEFYLACKPHLEDDFSVGISDDLFAGEFVLAVDDLAYELAGDGLVFDKALMDRLVTVFSREALADMAEGTVRPEFHENLAVLAEQAQ